MGGQADDAGKLNTTSLAQRKHNRELNKSHNVQVTMAKDLYDEGSFKIFLQLFF